jgi:RimJ/RimL family protein N-acetyltransferase
MKIILKTERLYLREFMKGDGFHFFQLNNDPDVLKYTGDTAFKSLAAANNFIESYADYQQNGYGRWAVCLKQTHEFLGWCGLKFDIEKNEVDVGFRFYKMYWGNNFATEAAKACIEYGFSTLKMKEIVGRAYKENVASVKVLEKCHMKFKKEFFYDFKPAVLYTIKNDTNKRNSS